MKMSHLSSENEWMQSKMHLEALIFAAPKGISIEEIKVKFSHLSTKNIKDLVKIINESYLENNSALEITQQGKVLQFQVKDSILGHPLVDTFTVGAGLNQSQIKTLACVAYNQPIEFQDVVELTGRGSKKALRDLSTQGFLKFSIEEYSVLNGQGEEITFKAKIYTTTPKFAAYFHIKDDPVVIREKLDKIVGYS